MPVIGVDSGRTASFRALECVLESMTEEDHRNVYVRSEYGGDRRVPIGVGDSGQREDIGILDR
jgi:hypothetical protein